MSSDGTHVLVLSDTPMILDLTSSRLTGTPLAVANAGNCDWSSQGPVVSKNSVGADGNLTEVVQFSLAGRQLWAWSAAIAGTVSTSPLTKSVAVWSTSTPRTVTVLGATGQVLSSHPGDGALRSRCVTWSAVTTAAR